MIKLKSLCFSGTISPPAFFLYLCVFSFYFLIFIENIVKVKPRNAPLAAVEDLDRETEGGYAVPRDTIREGHKVS